MTSKSMVLLSSPGKVIVITCGTSSPINQREGGSPKFYIYCCLLIYLDRSCLICLYQLYFFWFAWISYAFEYLSSLYLSLTNISPGALYLVGVRQGRFHLIINIVNAFSSSSHLPIVFYGWQPLKSTQEWSWSTPEDSSTWAILLESISYSSSSVRSSTNSRRNSSSV